MNIPQIHRVCMCSRVCSQVGGRIFVQVLMHVCAHVCGNPMLMPDVFLNLSQYWNRLSLLSLERASLTKAASQLVLGFPVLGGCHRDPASIAVFLGCDLLDFMFA